MTAAPLLALALAASAASPAPAKAPVRHLPGEVVELRAVDGWQLKAQFAVGDRIAFTASHQAVKPAGVVPPGNNAVGKPLLAHTGSGKGAPPKVELPGT